MLLVRADEYFKQKTPLSLAEKSGQTRRYQCTHKRLKNHGARMEENRG